MKLDYSGDAILTEYLESSKIGLHDYFETHYANRHTILSQQPKALNPSTSSAAPPHSPQKNFTARFQRKAKMVVNELEEYFKLEPEDFDLCHPIHWWMGR
jgi:hypothetical protein